jgi:ABC-type phosphate/phosphonate transport system permease subunit
MSSSSGKSVQEINHSDLTKLDWYGFYWRAFWRGLVINLAQLVAGTAVAFIVGMLFGIVLGERVSSILIFVKIVCILIAFPVVVALWVVWFRWCLSIKVGHLHLAIVKDAPNVDTSLQSNESLPELL